MLMAARGNEVGNWEDKARELLHTFRMEKHIHEYISKFSKGMKQKSMLILAFLTEPDFYIIDEPFIGLDPVATKEFLNYLYKEKSEEQVYYFVRTCWIQLKEFVKDFYSFRKVR